ncbi:hypothetical protein OH714_09995 [Pseudomonas capsici]|nr:hypothetical protein [Pseudomonas capsici]MCV4278054.1 hypothetical protein [Pseudomonas capsici]
MVVNPIFDHNRTATRGVTECFNAIWRMAANDAEGVASKLPPAIELA